MAKSKVVCARCGTGFLRENKNINKAIREKNKQYCSKTCQYAAQVNKESYTCSVCGNVFERTKSQANTDNLFCSHSCANGHNNTARVEDKHPLWKEGKASYRQRALKAYDNKCAICGYDTIAVLQVHHIDSNRRNNKLSNLLIVCPTHHKEFDLRLR